MHGVRCTGTAISLQLPRIAVLYLSAWYYLIWNTNIFRAGL